MYPIRQTRLHPPLPFVDQTGPSGQQLAKVSLPPLRPWFKTRLRGSWNSDKTAPGKRPPKRDVRPGLTVPLPRQRPSQPLLRVGGLTRGSRPVVMRRNFKMASNPPTAGSLPTDNSRAMLAMALGASALLSPSHSSHPLDPRKTRYIPRRLFANARAQRSPTLLPNNIDIEFLT